VERRQQPIFGQTWRGQLRRFFHVLFAGIAVMVILAPPATTRNLRIYKGEYYASSSSATLGMMLMAATTDLIRITSRWN
jgi:NADH:ubiquinone oxidoreductase subunit 2 (subunit N)